MKKSSALLFVCLAIRAATVTVCDSGCTYITANLQAAINARACGDHVQLKAQASVYPPFYLPGGNSLQCGSNPIYIENFNMAALPPTGAVITPAYVPLLPNIQTSTSVVVSTHNGGTDCGGGSNHCPANGWVLQGLRFSKTASSTNFCFIVFGQFDSTCTADTAIVVEADMPHNITFQHNYIQTNAQTITRRCMDVDFLGGAVRDNWIDCISPTILDGNTGDSQVLTGNPVGTQSARVQIDNNVLIGGTETVAWGTFPSRVRTGNGPRGWADETTESPNWIDVTNNHIWHDPYQLSANWTAQTYYRVGQAILSSTGSTPIFLAVTSGKTGGSEPNWAGTGVGSTVVDGGVTWFHPNNLWNNGTCSYSVKNHWETKSVLNSRVLNNFLDRLWAQCAAFGNQGRSIVPEVQTSTNGGGSASNITNVDVANNIGTNLSAAFQTLTTISFDDWNRFPRFFGTVVEPYNITAGNNTLKLSVDGQAAVTITLTTGATRTASQIATEINTAGNASTIAAVAYNISAGNTSSCTSSSTVCQLLIMRASTANPSSFGLFTNDAMPNPWNTATGTAVSISPATGTTATSVLGLPANGTTVYWCTNPYSLVWYGCGSGSNIAIRNNIFQMRHDGAYAPYAPYIGLLNSGVDGINLDHNLLTDPSGWASLGFLVNTPYVGDANSVGRSGSKGMRVQNNVFQDVGHFIGDSSLAMGAHFDWSGINYGCQTQLINAALSQGGDQTAQCDAAHLKGGFTKNLAYNIPFTNATCTVAGTTCNTSPADSDLGFGAQPNDNFNADRFSSLSFLQASPGNNAAPDYTLVYNPSNPQKYTRPSNFGNDNRPIGPDMTQMNFVRLIGGAPSVSDRAAIFTLNVTPPLMAKAGMVTVANDPFCDSPVTDMDPSQFPNPGWTDADRFPQFAAQRIVVVGLNARLSPGTTYYYCIDYQGYGMRGQFTTDAAITGTRTVRVQTTLTNLTQGATGANNMIVEYGTSYSRATDTLSGGGTTGPVSCIVGGNACVASFSASAGVPIFYRYKIRNAGGDVLITQPTAAQLAE
jgi:hypothetical protein